MATQAIHQLVEYISKDISQPSSQHKRIVPQEKIDIAELVHLLDDETVRRLFKMGPLLSTSEAKALKTDSENSVVLYGSL